MSRVRSNSGWLLAALAAVVALAAWQLLSANQPPPAPRAETPREELDRRLEAARQQEGKNDFAAVMARMKAAKADIAKKHNDLLAARYDLADRAGDGKMTRGKAVQAGPRAKLPPGHTWATLAAS